MPYVASRSPVTFTNERGPGAFAPLPSLPKASSKKSLFHIPSDDDQDQQEPSPPPTPRGVPPSLPTSVPFPTSSPTSPTTATSSAKSPTPPIQRTSSSTNVVLANGRPLKPSLKSASSSSIADDMAASSARHCRAQSMPSTPYGPKNVHFKEKDDGLESVRLFRRTGKPASVSKPTSDTETETEPEPSTYPFPHVTQNTFASSSSSALSEIASSSTIPASTHSPYANVHLESIHLPPARPPVLRGTIIVRNIAFEKSIGVRFTLDAWTTVSEVLATYSGRVSTLETLVGTNQGKTIGDLIGAFPESTWDRFNFAIKLEDYETHLWQRTLFLVVRYSAPGAGEWWDNNSGDNYRVTFRAHSTSVQPERKRGVAAPSVSPFLQKLIPDKDEVDEGFATGSEDDNAETCPESRPHLSLNISSPSPSPVTLLRANPLSPNPSPPPRQHGPFSPMRDPFSPRTGAGGGDSYAALIREWCFAQGPDTFGAGATIGVGAQSAVPWVGGLS
ncbi:putative phosphatase regulatory subunit domain containing protein [Lactarius tabidus]